MQLIQETARTHLPFTVHAKRRKLAVCALCNHVTSGGLPCAAGLVCAECVNQHGPDKAKGLAAMRKSK